MQYSSLHQLGSVTERAVFDAQQLHLIAGHSKVSIDRGEDVSVKPQPSKASEASSGGKAAKHMCGSHVAGYLKVQGGIWRHLPNTLLAVGELWRDDKLPLTPDSHAPHTLDRCRCCSDHHISGAHNSLAFRKEWCSSQLTSVSAVEAQGSLCVQ